MLVFLGDKCTDFNGLKTPVHDYIVRQQAAGGSGWRASRRQRSRRHCATARRTLTQTRHRTHLSGGRADSIHTAIPDTIKQSYLCRVQGRILWWGKLGSCPGTSTTNGLPQKNSKKIITQRNIKMLFETDNLE